MCGIFGRCYTQSNSFAIKRAPNGSFYYAKILLITIVNILCGLEQYYFQRRVFCGWQNNKK